MRPKDNDGPFPKSVFPTNVFPRRIFPWIGGDDDEPDDNTAPDWPHKKDNKDNNDSLRNQ